MTDISMPVALIACTAIICITIFATAVTLKGMEIGLREKKKE